MKLRIDKAVYGGSGLGRVSDEADPLFGKTVFVPFTLPGETVEIHIAEDKRSYATGELDSILEGSRCTQLSAVPLLRKLRRLSLPTLHLRKSIADEALHSSGGTLTRPTEEFAGDRGCSLQSPLAYRNRIRLLVQRQPEFALCYRRGGSHATVAVSQCPIAAPLLQRAIEVITERGSELGLG